jgi:uncharacterized membrane protein
MRVPPCDIAPIEFCALFKIKADIWHELQERGLGPKVHRHPGTDLERISPAAIRAWQEAVKDPNCEAAKILRRYAVARRSGLASLQSPNHPANLLRALKAARESAAE